LFVRVNKAMINGMRVPYVYINEKIINHEEFATIDPSEPLLDLNKKKLLLDAAKLDSDRLLFLLDSTKFNSVASGENDLAPVKQKDEFEDINVMDPEKINAFLEKTVLAYREEVNRINKSMEHLESLEVGSMEDFEFIEIYFVNKRKIQEMRTSISLLFDLINEMKERRKLRRYVWKIGQPSFAYMKIATDEDMAKRRELQEKMKECESLGILFNRALRDFFVSEAVMGDPSHDPLQQFDPSIASPSRPAKSMYASLSHEDLQRRIVSLNGLLKQSMDLYRRERKACEDLEKEKEQLEKLLAEHQ